MFDRFRLIHFSDECPYQNIALDEVLLLKTIKNRIPYLRIWENRKKVIYLGVGNKFHKEVFLQRCQKDSVPIIRRFSGGGSVFHNKGVLNYTLTFPLEKFPLMNSLTHSYAFILKWINKIFEKFSLKFSLNGFSDFCLNGYKVSGNAQARRSETLLHHGTFLLTSQIKDIDHYLKEPFKQPLYREKKKHSHFVSSLSCQNHCIKKIWLLSTIKKSYWIHSKEKFSPKDTLQALQFKKKKYNSDTWNFKI